MDETQTFYATAAQAIPALLVVVSLETRAALSYLPTRNKHGEAVLWPALVLAPMLLAMLVAEAVSFLALDEGPRSASKSIVLLGLYSGAGLILVVTGAFLWNLPRGGHQLLPATRWKQCAVHVSVTTVGAACLALATWDLVS